MEEFLDGLNRILSAFANAIWSWPLIVLLLGTHIFLTLYLRFPQRHVFKAIKFSFKKDKGASGDVSQFGALMTSLAATVGTGNIIGVATAVILGGPGAVLWCWLTGVFGMATKYSEGLLAVKYRVRHADGTIVGGPMSVLERALNLKVLAVIFCVFTVLTGICCGNMIQGNSISVTLQSAYHIPMVVTATALSLIVAVVSVFGLKGIVSVCSKLVPFMAIFYITGCFVILFINYHYLGDALLLILKSAFDYHAVGWGITGGFIGVVQNGITRGVLSNESGMGSAPIVAASARTRNPVRQALVSSTGTFWDTVVICALTGITLVSTIVNPDNGINASQINVSVFAENLTQRSFAEIPWVGSHVLCFGLFIFAFSTILGWSFYGEKALEYLFKRKGAGTKVYRGFWIVATFIGAMLPLPLVWNLGTATMAFMAIPNLISLLLMCRVLKRETRHYLWENRLDEESHDEIPPIK